MKYFILTLTILSALSSAHALDKDRGGGDSVSVKGQHRLLDLAETQDLEYFVPKFSYGFKEDVARGMASLITTAAMCAPSYMEEYCSDLFNLGNIRFLKALSVAYDLDGRAPSDPCDLTMELFLTDDRKNQTYCFTATNKSHSAMSNMEENLKKGALPPLKPLRWAFTDASLENINDEGILRVENPKTKRQVAIQKGELVIINKKEFKRMDPTSQDALFIHEAGLYALKKLNPALIQRKGTAPLRAYVKALVAFFQNRRGFPIYAVKEAFDELGIEDKFTRW